MAIATSSRTCKVSLLWITLAAVALTLVGAALTWRLGVARPGTGEAPQVGEMAPDFRRGELGGAQVTLSDFRGRAVLLDFWATWCGPCHIQDRILEPIYADYRGRGVEFLAVSLGEDEQTVAEFMRDHPRAWRVLLDPENTLTTQYNVYALPTLVIVGGDGRIVYSQPGLSDGDALRRALDQAIGGG